MDKKYRKSVAHAFGLTLKEARNNRGLSQREFALEAEVDKSHISILERGKNQPLLSTFLELADSLRVPPRELFDLMLTQLEKSS